MLKALGALGLALYVLAGRRALGGRVPGRRRRAGAEHQPLQPARPAPGPGGQGVRRARRGADARLVGHLRARRRSGLFIGPALVLLPYDLRERAMLGDAGSNVLGAVAGLWLVLALGPTGEAVALGVLARSHSLRGVSLDQRAGGPEPSDASSRLTRQAFSRHGQIHLRDRRRGLFPRQGHRLRLDRPPAREPRPAGPDPEVRPVHQRRPGHDEPVPARRGVRHRGRRRDRPRPRPLRALHRREHVAHVQRHRRGGLLLGDPQGAPRRLPRRHGAGDPARHRRDQAAREAGRRVAGPRLRDHRDRRHRRRHRVAAVPGGDPPAPDRAGPRPLHLRAPHAGAVHRPRR